MTTNRQLDIDADHVLRNIGYGADYKPGGRIASLINEYLENVHRLIEPSYSFVIKDVKSVKGSHTTIDGGITLKSEVVARLLEQYQQVAVFALTIGSRLEEMVSLLTKRGRMLKATVLDGIGSDAAEKLADSVQNEIGELASIHGLCISQRFSPGYCDWDVSQQRMIFQAMNGDFAGIRLTEDCLMLPQKSISGVIGIGPCDDVETYNPCLTCEKHGNCQWRR